MKYYVYLKNQVELIHDAGLVLGSLDSSFIIPFSDDKGLIILDAFISSKDVENYDRSVKRLKVTKDYRYSSPETIQNFRPINNEDDYWSIGIILLEMCFGFIPLEINEYFTLTKEKILNLFTEKCYSLELIEIITNLLLNRGNILPEIKAKSIEVHHQRLKYKRESINFRNNRIRRLRLESNSKIKLDCQLDSEIFTIMNKKIRSFDRIKEVNISST